MSCYEKSIAISLKCLELKQNLDLQKQVCLRGFKDFYSSCWLAVRDEEKKLRKELAELESEPKEEQKGDCTICFGTVLGKGKRWCNEKCFCDCHKKEECEACEAEKRPPIGIPDGEPVRALRHYVHTCLPPDSPQEKTGEKCTCGYEMKRSTNGHLHLHNCDDFRRDQKFYTKSDIDLLLYEAGRRMDLHDNWIKGLTRISESRGQEIGEMKSEEKEWRSELLDFFLLRVNCKRRLSIDI